METLSRVLNRKKRIKILILVTLISNKLNKLNNLCVIELTSLNSGLMKTSITGAINRVLATWTKQTKVSIKIFVIKRRGYFL
jgi:hypothetical protein